MTVFFYVNPRIRNPSYGTVFGMFLHIADKAGTTVLEQNMISLC